MVVNLTVNLSVTTYAESIKREIQDMNFTLNVDVEYLDMPSADFSQTANSAVISTDFGTVTIMPDYENNNCAAMTFNAKLADAMLQEAFDQEFIDKEGVLYGTPLKQTDENVNMFAKYLTRTL